MEMNADINPMMKVDVLVYPLLKKFEMSFRSLNKKGKIEIDKLVLKFELWKIFSKIYFNESFLLRIIINIVYNVLIPKTFKNILRKSNEILKKLSLRFCLMYESSSIFFEK
jgi:hypothetical protein